MIALVKAQYERALALLQAHRSQLDYLAKELYEKEVLTGEEFNRLMQQSSVSPIPADGVSTQPRLDG